MSEEAPQIMQTSHKSDPASCVSCPRGQKEVSVPIPACNGVSAHHHNAAFHSTTRVQVGNGVHMCISSRCHCSSAEARLLLRRDTALTDEVKTQWVTTDSCFLVGSQRTMSPAVLLFPAWEQIEEMTSYDSSDSLVCVDDSAARWPTPHMSVAHNRLQTMWENEKCRTLTLVFSVLFPFLARRCTIAVKNIRVYDFNRCCCCCGLHAKWSYTCVSEIACVFMGAWI